MKKSALFSNFKLQIIQKMYLLVLLVVSLTGRSLCASEEKPTIYDLTFGTKLAENKKFLLICLIPSGDHEIGFEWFLNGQKVVPNENVFVNQHEDSSMLNIRSMSLELAGEYECRVSNRFGSDIRSISVKLDGKLLMLNIVYHDIKPSEWLQKF